MIWNVYWQAISHYIIAQLLPWNKEAGGQIESDKTKFCKLHLQSYKWLQNYIASQQLSEIGLFLYIKFDSLISSPAGWSHSTQQKMGFIC